MVDLTSKQLEQIKKLSDCVREEFVVDSVRKYLEAQGWNLNPPKESKHHHGPDIIGFHSGLKKDIIVEAGGESPGYEHQSKHNEIYRLLGQIVFKMDMEPGLTKIYALAFPEKWAYTFAGKKREMDWAWKTLRLKVFLIHKDGRVEESPDV